MARMVEAIYEKGMLKLLETVGLLEHQHVRITSMSHSRRA